MKRHEPEFDQWTDQNHVPYCPRTSVESQRISSVPFGRRSFNLIWHGVLKLFGHSQTAGTTHKNFSGPYLS